MIELCIRHREPAMRLAGGYGHAVGHEIRAEFSTNFVFGLDKFPATERRYLPSPTAKQPDGL